MRHDALVSNQNIRIGSGYMTSPATWPILDGIRGGSPIAMNASLRLLLLSGLFR